MSTKITITQEKIKEENSIIKQIAEALNVPEEAILYKEAYNLVTKEFYDQKLLSDKSNKQYYLKNTYGIDVEDFDNLYTAQGGLCAVCNNTKLKTELVVDHEHCDENNDGNVRGLLCSPCNLMLGHGKDNPLTFINAAKYIEKSHYYYVVVENPIEGDKVVKLKRKKIPDFRPNSLINNK